MKYIGTIILWVAVLVFPTATIAGCFYDGGSQWNLVISLGNMTVQRDAPIGTIIATTLVTNSDKSASCTANSARYRTLTYNGGMVSSVPGVYNTNLPGVGIQLPDTLFSNPASIWPGFSSGYAASHHQVIVNIIKTGDITPGELSIGEIANEKFDGVVAGTYLTTEIISMGAGNRVSQLACSIGNANIQVPLEDVMADTFTAAGTTAKPRNFNLDLNCDAGARVNAMLTGVQNSDTSTAGVLQLTGAGSAGVASGVGVQILYNNAPLALNNNMVLKTSAGGQETFPFTAQYYQTKDSVTAGSANAIATLNLTYQ